MLQNKAGTYIIPYLKMDSKWIKDQNVKPQTIIFLNKSIQQKLHDTGFDKDFLNMSPKAQATTTKIDKMGFRIFF